MIFYWDTSAVINACVCGRVLDRLEVETHVTRTHTLAEFFATMTGRGISVMDTDGPARFVMSPRDAVGWLRKFCARVQTVDLDTSETLDALDRGRDVLGGRVYDYCHAVVAAKATADIILTRNPDDFQTIAGQARIEWP